MFITRLTRVIIERALIPTLLATVSAFALPSAASAATITVTSNADSGPGTLRAALAGAQPGDAIAVPAMTITLTSGPLYVSKGVTIQGAGPRASRIIGDKSDAVFQVNALGVAIDGLMITTGGGTSPPSGGVYSSYGLALSHDAIIGNSGGGVTVAGFGGSLLVDHSLIAYNQSPDGYPGGGVDLQSSPGSSITNTTIADNSAEYSGGGIYSLGSGLTLAFDTVAGNSVTDPSGNGGNIYLASGTARVGDTIIAGGMGANGADCYGGGGASWTSLGHNAEDTDPDGGCWSLLTGAGDRSGLALDLGPLQNNGGPTDTILPAAGSPVIGQADPAVCPADDQRDASRSQAACDIGAAQRPAPTSVSGLAFAITTAGAMLTGTLNTEGLAGSAHYVYGTTPSFGAQTLDSALNATSNWQTANATLTGLEPATTYYFALVVTTSHGSTTGQTVQFRTLAPTPVVCSVPWLIGDSLAQARRVLAYAHCALGKVSHAKVTRRRRLVVVAQHTAAGTPHPSGFRVALTLGVKQTAARR